MGGGAPRAGQGTSCLCQPVLAPGAPGAAGGLITAPSQCSTSLPLRTRKVSNVNTSKNVPGGRRRILTEVLVNDRHEVTLDHHDLERVARRRRRPGPRPAAHRPGARPARAAKARLEVLVVTQPRLAAALHERRVVLLVARSASATRSTPGRKNSTATFLLASSCAGVAVQPQRGSGSAQSPAPPSIRERQRAQRIRSSVA